MSLAPTVRRKTLIHDRGWELWWGSPYDLVSELSPDMSPHFVTNPDDIILVDRKMRLIPENQTLQAI